jgi:exosortase/archaeosortase family protein
MKYEKKLVLRLAALIIIFLIPNLILNLFSKPTIYLSYYSLKLLSYNPLLIGNDIIINQTTLTFIPACVATSAYYLLIALILLTKDLKLKKIFYTFLIGSLLILIFNILRIDVLAFILMNFSRDLFNTVHLFIWKFLSGIYVGLVWILLIKIFRIKLIPVYSDFKYLIKKRNK